MKGFTRGDNVAIKNLNELKYTEQDMLTSEDMKKLGLQAVFMFYEEKDRCVVSIERESYEIPLWLIKKQESKSSISRPCRIETYQCTDRKELMSRIEYIIAKTGFNFNVIQLPKEIILTIEE